MIDMEGPIWEVNVRTLEARRLFVKPVPGWHAKGGYTGQGRLIVANNGELRTADLDKLQWKRRRARGRKARRTRARSRNSMGKRGPSSLGGRIPK